MKSPLLQKVLVACFVGIICIMTAISVAMNPALILKGFINGYRQSDAGDSVYDKLKNGIDKFDSRVNEHIVFHDLSINLYGAIQGAMGKSLVNDVDKESEVVKLDNGYLCFKSSNEIHLSELGEYMEQLNSLCKEQGTDLIFVNNPDKDYGIDQYVSEIYPYCLYNDSQVVFAQMENNGIEVLDFEKYCQDNGIDKYSLFYKTDHHWHTKGALFATEVIIDTINNAFGYNLDTYGYNEEIYEVEHYEDCFLGSQGRRVGMIYGGIDDFDIITLVESPEYTVEIPSEDKVLTGDFEDVFINRDLFSEDGMLKIAATNYNVYMRENYDLVKITNHSLKDGKKVLMVMNSYGMLAAPFLSQSFSEMHCIDIREYKDSLTDYISEYNPDLVIYAVRSCQDN